MIEYDVNVPDLTAEMLDDLLSWVETTWGGVELVTVTPHATRNPAKMEAI